MSCIPSEIKNVKTSLTGLPGHVDDAKTTINTQVRAIDEILGDEWTGFHYTTLAGAQADALAASDPTPVGTIVTVLNYALAGDQGGALYRVVGGSDIGCVGTHPDAPNLSLISNVITPQMFGAVGDGTADDTTAMQNAVDAAVTSSGKVVVPAGTYLVSGETVDGVRIDSNVTIEGEGYGSKFLFKSGAKSPARMFSINGLTGVQKENITIRNIHFAGTVATDGFDEFRHLLYMYGVKNVTVENCWFIGFEGDGIGLAWTPLTEGNENVTIRRNVFDGVNKDNRNAISIIGCDKLTIEDNLFKNITRANMPGAIDIEPNPDYGFIAINAVTIKNNRFDNIGGNVGAMAMFLPLASKDFTRHPANITIENNVFTDVFRGVHCTQLQSTNVDDTDPFINLRVENNKVTNATDRAIWVYGLNGVVIENNKFTSCANSSRIGWSTNHRGCNNIILKNNVFEENGTIDGYAIQSYQSNRVSFTGNTFIDCGQTAGTFGVCVNFATASADNVIFSDNRIINPSGRTTGAVSRSGDISVGVISDLSKNFFADLGIGGIGSVSLREVATVSKAISDSETGKTFYLNAASGFTLTLPVPADGLFFRFIVKTAPTAAYRIQTNGSAPIIYGTINETVDANAGIVQGASVKTFAANLALRGDWMELRSDGTYWYLKGSTQADLGIG